MSMRPFIAAMALCLCACWPGPEVGAPIAPSTGGGGLGGQKATFTEIAEVILVPSCASSYCHSGNPPLAAPMTLEALEAYDAMVNVKASQAPAMMRVEPFNPEGSYLIHKLRGTARSVGGNGTRMPLNKGKLDEQLIVIIEEWISRGAPND
jgi:hypothetical protein